MSELKRIITEYLEQAKLMQVATSSRNQPWACSVWFAFDADLSLYWFSWIGRRHSVEIKKNPRVAGTIVLPQEPEDIPKGLQFEGIAEELARRNDTDFAKKLYSRIFSPHKVDELMHSKEHPHRFYRIKPSKYVIFDPADYPEAPLQEMKMR